MKDFFSIKIRNSKLWKMPNLLNFRFPEVFFFVTILNWKDPLKYFFSVAERHRWAVGGGVGPKMRSRLYV